MNKIGALISLRPDTDVAAEFARAREIGCECCQITVWDMSLYNDDVVSEVKRACADFNFTVTAV